MPGAASARLQPSGTVGDQAVGGDGDQLGVRARPTLDEPEDPVADGVRRRRRRPTAATTPAYSEPSTCDPRSRPAADSLVHPRVPGPVGAVGAVDRRGVDPDQELAGRRAPGSGRSTSSTTSGPPYCAPHRCSHGSSMEVADGRVGRRDFHPVCHHEGHADAAARAAPRRLADRRPRHGRLVVLLWALEIIDTASGHSLDPYGVHPRSEDGLPGGGGSRRHSTSASTTSSATPSRWLVLGFLTLASGIARGLGATAVIWIVAGLGVWLFGECETPTTPGRRR